MAEHTKQHWNEYWEQRDRSLSWAENKKLVSTLLSLMDVQNKKILEIGVGTGGDSVHLTKLGALVCSLDYSEQALKLVQELCNHNQTSLPPLLGADAFQLPFLSDSFDLIFHQGFLEHFENPEVLLAEQKRVLKPGGYVVVDVPQKYTLYTLRKNIAIRRGKWFAGWERQFSPAELESLVEGCGFEVVQTYGWGTSASVGWPIRNAIHRLRSLLKREKKQQVEAQTVLPPSIGKSSQNGPLRRFTERFYLHIVDCVGVVGRKK